MRRDMLFRMHDCGFAAEAARVPRSDRENAVYQRILLPIDGSPLARAAALDGIAIARAFGAAAHGLYVMAPYPSLITYPCVVPGSRPGRTQYEAQVRLEAESKLKVIAEAARAAGVAWRQTVLLSAPVDAAIIACAKRNRCDLIVMGSHGRRGGDRSLPGSVASAVLARCRIPVLVHRAARRRTPAREDIAARPARRDAKVEERHTW